VAALAVLSAGLAARAATVVTVNAKFDNSTTSAAWNNAPVGTTLYSSQGTSASVWKFSNVSFTDSNSSDPLILGSLSNATLGISKTSLENYLVGGFNAVCIDRVGDVVWNTGYSWTVDSLDSLYNVNIGNGVVADANQLGAIASLWNARYAKDAGETMTAFNAAAFQMAVWDILYAYDSSTVSIKTLGAGFTGAVNDSTYATAAKEWANTALQNQVATDNMYVLLGANASVPQDFGFAIVSGSSVVPLPSSVGMGLSMLAGLGCVFGLRKRMNRSPV